MNSTHEKQTTIRDVLSDPEVSAGQKYRAMVMGNVSWWQLALFELVNLFFSSLPGAVGVILRRSSMRPFFKSCGSNLVIGRGCTIRHPGKMIIGSNVVLDDYCCLDARGASSGGFVVEDSVVVNRLVEIRSKQGDIHIGTGVNIGSACQIISHSGIRIGKGASIAGDCGLRSGSYGLEDMHKPVAERRSVTKGPIIIGDDAWLAARVTVLDAVEIGNGAIIAAGSVVNANIPPGTVAHGNPAKVIFEAR